MVQRRQTTATSSATPPHTDVSRVDLTQAVRGVEPGGGGAGITAEVGPCRLGGVGGLGWAGMHQLLLHVTEVTHQPHVSLLPAVAALAVAENDLDRAGEGGELGPQDVTDLRVGQDIHHLTYVQALKKTSTAPPP